MFDSYENEMNNDQISRAYDAITLLFKKSMSEYCHSRQVCEARSGIDGVERVAGIDFVEIGVDNSKGEFVAFVGTSINTDRGRTSISAEARDPMPEAALAYALNELVQKVNRTRAELTENGNKIEKYFKIVSDKLN